MHHTPIVRTAVSYAVNFALLFAAASPVYGQLELLENPVDWRAQLANHTDSVLSPRPESTRQNWVLEGGEPQLVQGNGEAKFIRLARQSIATSVVAQSRHDKTAVNITSHVFELSPGGMAVVLFYPVDDKPETSYTLRVFTPVASAVQTAGQDGYSEVTSKVLKKSSQERLIALFGDFDGNTSPDVIFASILDLDPSPSAHMSISLDFVLTDQSSGRAVLSSIGAVPQTRLANFDFLDVDANNRVEVLTKRMRVGFGPCIDGKDHSFFVYDLIGFQNLKLVDLNKTSVGFPRFEWYSLDPQKRNRQLLTPEMKSKVYDCGFGIPAFRKAAQPTPRAVTTRPDKARKLRYVQSSNRGITGYFSDGTRADCPQCDLNEQNMEYLNSDDAALDGQFWVDPDGSIVVELRFTEHPSWTAEDFGDWAMIDYIWRVRVK